MWALSAVRRNTPPTSRRDLTKRASTKPGAIQIGFSKPPALDRSYVNEAAKRILELNSLLHQAVRKKLSRQTKGKSKPYPFGRLSDRMSHTRLLALGLVVLIAADLVLAIDTHWTVVLVGVGLWGIHMGITQGLLATLIAHTAPADLRGTAYGFFNLISGLALLCASVLAGWLWEHMGASMTFYAGACISAAALVALMRPRPGMLSQD